MSEYIWETLIALYDRLRMREKFKLKNIDRYIELDRELSDILKASQLLSNLTEVVKKILIRMHRVFVEEVRVEQYHVKGKILFNCLARYFPNNIPVKLTKITIEEPANLLLVISILETKQVLTASLRKLSYIKPSSSLKPLQKMIEKEFCKSIDYCNYLLLEPVLKSLVPKAKIVLGNKKEVHKLENMLKSLILKKPKEFKPYTKLITYRTMLKKNLVIIGKKVAKLKELLTLQLSPEKLYELYCFTLILETIIELFNIDDEWRIHLKNDGKVLFFSKDSVKVKLSYNALISDVKSRLSYAKAYGIINGPIDEVRLLGGLPDTIIKVEVDTSSKLIIIDYKFSRNLSYVIGARFKVYAYLHEFEEANTAILVIPSLEHDSKIEDDESYKQKSFYEKIIPHKGATVHINYDGKTFVILIIDPSEEDLQPSKNALRRLFKMILSDIFVWV